MGSRGCEGRARRWLPNASGLSWMGADELLYSETKKMSHMAVVRSTTTRTDARDVYVPANESHMAHRAAASPDGRWVIVVEMAASGLFGPCRVRCSRMATSDSAQNPACTRTPSHGRTQFVPNPAGALRREVQRRGGSKTDSSACPHCLRWVRCSYS